MRHRTGLRPEPHRTASLNDHIRYYVQAKVKGYCLLVFLFVYCIIFIFQLQDVADKIKWANICCLTADNRAGRSFLSALLGRPFCFCKIFPVSELFDVHNHQFCYSKIIIC